MNSVERLDAVAEPDDALADHAALVVETLHEELPAGGRGAVLIVPGAAQDGSPFPLPRLPVDGEEALPSGYEGVKLVGGRRRRHRLHGRTAGDAAADQHRSSEYVGGFHGVILLGP